MAGGPCALSCENLGTQGARARLVARSSGSPTACRAHSALCAWVAGCPGGGSVPCGCTGGGTAAGPGRLVQGNQPAGGPGAGAGCHRGRPRPQVRGVDCTGEPGGGVAVGTLEGSSGAACPVVQAPRAAHKGLSTYTPQPRLMSCCAVLSCAVLRCAALCCAVLRCAVALGAVCSTMGNCGSRLSLLQSPARRTRR